MQLGDVMAELESLGTEKMRAQNTKRGAGPNQFGLTMGDIRNVAKKIKSDHALAKQLWATGNVDARFLATLITKPKEFSKDELAEMVGSESFSHLLDYVNSNVVKLHPAKEEIRLEWEDATDPAKARAYWSLTTERVIKNPAGLDFGALLDRIEKEMATAHELPKWTMNYCLAEIGITSPDHRARALAIGEKLGVYRDYPVSKGCTSPFAPIWINEMVSRQK